MNRLCDSIEFTAPARTTLGVFSMLLLASMFLVARPASAQVAFSLSAQEIYDDNIYLEDDKGFPLPIIIDDTLETDPEDYTISDKADGDPNSDMITNIGFGLSTPLELSQHLKGGAEANGGAFFFADEDDENRFSLGSTVKLESEPSLIADPFYVTAVSRIEGTQGVAVAEGTATKLAHIHRGTLDLGFREWTVSSSSNLGIHYTLVREDFLGEFLMDKSKREADERFEEEGSDFWQHDVTALYRYFALKTLELQFSATGSLSDYTQVETNSLIEKSPDELDRSDVRSEIGAYETLSKEWQLVGKLGFDYSRYKEERDPRMVSIEEEDGTFSTLAVEREQDLNNLRYTALINYLPEGSKSNFSLGIIQESGSDLDGERILTRTLLLNGSYSPNDRLMGSLGGRFLQYDSSDDLANANERWEITASLRYNITQYLAISAGYNFASQETESPENEIVFPGQDYESNRFFIVIDAGLVGITS